MNENASRVTSSLDLFTEPRRRRVVQCLGEAEDGMALADLATDVAALEREVDPREVPPEAVERTYVSLYHRHVPKLADRDVVEYREDQNVVSLASEGERVERARRVVDDASVWHRA